MEDIYIRKQMLRKKYKDIRDSIPPDIRRNYNKKILERVITLPEYVEGSTILTYTSFGSEADTRELIGMSLSNGKKVAVPKVMKGNGIEFYYISGIDELHIGRMGILEPDVTGKKAVACGEDYECKKNFEHGPVLICIPGLAFDNDMNRLGYGGGYYDKYLERLDNICFEHDDSRIKFGNIYNNQANNNAVKRQITKVALLYECQMEESIPITNDDVKMDMLVTEKQQRTIR